MAESPNIKIGVMGSAADSGTPEARAVLIQKGENLAAAIANRECVLLTGATTGIVYVVGKAAHDAGTFHIGVSPGASEREHIDAYKLPLDACDAIVYTGFGLKGRNVVLVRSCDIVLFIAGAMGSLNEFTIAHDEGKIIGCLTGSGGVADEVDYLLEKFGKRSHAQVFKNSDPDQLIEECIESLGER
ncbi:MAG: hypothetical protein C5B55_15020 [Blastocatellia bacterium]|nr:MAG: hypothetical protein C5B55_15020 [Blastocatellia bacterium]